MADQRRGDASWRSVVKEDQHQRRIGASRLRAAKSKTAVTCSRVTSNCSMISSMVMPSSRFSKIVATGMRVPRKTHAPLTLPGTLSTAEHCDQSSTIRKSPKNDCLLILVHFTRVSNIRTVISRQQKTPQRKSGWLHAATLNN